MTIDEYKALQQRIVNLYVEHPEVKRVWNLLDFNRSILRRSGKNSESPIHLSIQGKPGAGKSLCVKKYAEKNATYTEKLPCGGKVDFKPVAYMATPIPFTYKGLYNGILRALDLPTNPRERTVEAIKHQAYEQLSDMRVEMLIIDELDYLLHSSHVKQTDAMENIKDIANSAGVCLVLVGTTAIEPLRKLNSQHVGRYPRTVLRHFTACDADFLAFLTDIENQIDIPKLFRDTEYKDKPPIRLGLGDENSAIGLLLYDLSGGMVRWVKRILLDAFRQIGVLDDDFNDYRKFEKLNGDVLFQAQQNMIGEFAEEDMNKILDAVE